MIRRHSEPRSEEGCVVTVQTEDHHYSGLGWGQCKGQVLFSGDISVSFPWRLSGHPLPNPSCVYGPSSTPSRGIPDPQEGIWHIRSYVKFAETQAHGSSDQILSLRTVELTQAAVGLGRQAHHLRLVSGTVGTLLPNPN